MTLPFLAILYAALIALGVATGSVWEGDVVYLGFLGVMLLMGSW